MRKILFSFAACLLACGASAQSLKISSVGSGIYCRFSGDCQVTPTEQSDSLTSTNAPVTFVLASRSFAGNTVNSTGQYGYEYQLTLNSLNNNGVATDTNIVTVNSLTLNFGQPETFAFGEHASNYVWALTSDGPVGSAPSDANSSGDKITFQFDPPLTLNTSTDQTTNTCYFGMVSDGAPQTTVAAILSGSIRTATNGVVAFKAKFQTQTPAAPAGN